jgi:hypothetical protein
MKNWSWRSQIKAVLLRNIWNTGSYFVWSLLIAHLFQDATSQNNRAHIKEFERWLWIKQDAEG